MIPQISALTLVAKGYAAANKPLNSFKIEVVDPEAMNMLDGEITDNLTTTEGKGVDADGNAFQTTVRSSPTVTARWMPFRSNRKTPPDIRRGEEVALYRFSDNDQYYWGELEYNADLRKLETVVYSFSATTDEGAKADENNTYYFCISTHTKTVQFHTSQANGEPFGYDFIFNTKDGTVQLVDTADNMFFLNSELLQLVLRTGEGAYFELIGKHLNLNIPGNVTGVIGGNLGLRVDGNTSIATTGNIGVSSGGTSSWASAGDFNTQAPAVNFNTPKLFTTAILQTGGNAIIGGSLELAGGMRTGTEGGSGSGTISINGSLSVSGSGTFVGRVKAENID